jgi:tRNA(Ile)-lysidine synthase
MTDNSEFLAILDAGLDQASVPDGSNLVVAFSGGPDSTALLGGLVELSNERQLTLVATHINHQIRPDSSNQDQQAAERIAESLGVEFAAVRTDVPERAANSKVSIEVAARNARYEALAKISDARSAFGVVTGHTRDDQAETILFHAARGAGIKGISGMDYRTNLLLPGSGTTLTVLRPMLDVPGSACVEYCKRVGIDPVIDESNLTRDYTRNKLRLDVLPLLNDAVPGASLALTRLAKNASDDLEIIDWVVERHLDTARIERGSYSRSSIEGLPGALVSRVLIRAYESHVGHTLNLERTHVTDMVGMVPGRSGTSIKLPNDVVFYIDKDAFGFRSSNEDDCPYPTTLATTEMTLPGITQLGDNVAISADIIERPERLDPGDPHIVFTAPELAREALTLRKRKNGDRFQPLGMDPQVKLQDFFVGAGVPERWRDRIPLVESDRGIIWIAGYRLAEWAKVLPEHDQVARFELVGARSPSEYRSG